MLGTRGIPASYSGFETCVERLGERLIQRGHSVAVYCRSHHISYSDKYYKGMRLVRLPTIPNKYLDTIVHTFLSSMHAITQGYDIALYFIVGNSPVAWIPRMVGTKTILNVDGLDWKREKWPPLAKKYIRFCEKLATILPNSFITDSSVVQEYYEKTYGISPPVIPYGSDISYVEPGETLSRYSLEPGKYILFVGRLVPENCVHHLVEACRGLDTDLKCVIVGDSSYAKNYKNELRSMAGDDPRIVFTGYVFGRSYYELGSNAYIFVETSGVGGTHPALVEAMAFGNCIVVHDTPENLETIHGAGFHYNGQVGADSLSKILIQLISNPGLVSEFRDKARLTAQKYYSWQVVTDEYERLFYQELDLPLPEHLQSMPAA